MKRISLTIILMLFALGCGGESGSSKSVVETDYSAATIIKLECGPLSFDAGDITDRPDCDIQYRDGTYPVTRLVISEPIQDQYTAINLGIDKSFDFNLIFDEDLLAAYKDNMYRIWLKSPLGIYTYNIWLENDLGPQSEVEIIKVQANNDKILDNYTSSSVSENMILNSYSVSTDGIIYEDNKIYVDYFVNFSSFAGSDLNPSFGISQMYFFDDCTNSHLFAAEAGSAPSPLSSADDYVFPIEYDTSDLYSRLIEAGTLNDCYDEYNQTYKIRLDIRALSDEYIQDIQHVPWSNWLKEEYFILDRF